MASAYTIMCDLKQNVNPYRVHQEYIERDSIRALNIQEVIRRDAVDRHEVRVGHVVSRLDGVIERVAYVWPFDDGKLSSYQAEIENGGGSYHVSDFGVMTYSGGLGFVENRKLRRSSESCEVEVWFSAMRRNDGGSGVRFRMAVPVWIEVES